ncbi:MAG TPA: hypothetical protein VN915_02405 [Elusimicrobiota bacterium]|nr:hypothetical protein [Elusimicrobiota bacterium]
MTRFSFLAVAVLAANAFAQADLSDSTLKGAIAQSRQRASLVLKCAAKNGDKYYSVDGRLELGSMILTVGGVKSSLLKVSKDSDPVDSRCGTTAAPLESSLNYEVTSPHKWGQDILQLPKNALAATGAFDANLHTCDYDGNWSASHDAAVSCTLTSK